MNIVYKRPGDLIPYGNNAKTHPDAQLANITVSLERYGWRVPVLIDRRGVIIAGHGRVEAALRSPVLRDKPVPCIVADDLTDAQAAEFRIVDNKTAESPWDMDALAAELDTVDLSDFDFDFGLEMADEYGTDFSLPDGDKPEMVQITFVLHERQKELLERALDAVRGTETETFGNTNKNGNALYEVVRQWATQNG